MQQVANLLQMPGVAEMAQQMSAIYPQMPGPVTGAQTVSRQMAGPVTGVQTGEQTGEQMSQMSAGFPQMAGAVRGEQTAAVPTAMPMMHSTMPAAMMMPAIMMPASLQLPQTAATLPQPARSEVQVASVDILENTLSSYQLDPNISIPVDIQNIAA